MLRGFLTLCAALLLLPACARAEQVEDAPSAEEAEAGAPARLGINFAGPKDWNSEIPLADVFRLSRTWISQRDGAAWGEGPPLEVDEHGWVRRLEPGGSADTPMVLLDDGHVPSGVYLVEYAGSGRLEFRGSAEVVERAPGRMLVEVDGNEGAIWLRLAETDPADPLRDVHVILPGQHQTWREQPWNPTFLERWRGMDCLRFMDFQHTNDSPVESWEDRPRMEDARWTEAGGMPPEMLCDLANRLDADAWFCVPHRADDGWVRGLARLCRERLEPGRRVYLEYSNEVWNGIFDQHDWAAARGRELGLAEEPWEAAWLYTARRSVEIFAVFAEEFGDDERLVRVLSGQAANPRVAERILAFEDAHEHADALAIAPYFGLAITPEDAPAFVAGGVESVLDRLEEERLPLALERMRRHAALARRHGLELLAYEAGQHLVGRKGGQDDDALTEVLVAANRHPRMGDLYARYYAGWEEAGGGLLCHFSSVVAPSKFGCWGLLEYHDQPPATSPKFVATMNWGAALGQDVALPRPASPR